ncbi:putative lipoprotein [Crenothrix polyspora]|uniref:Lipoprotein n=1 Tax=Crenothrix polyspora TaxID=360316 RepID=A0A1R4H7T2_9GAMM|nr:putative lipoprotein [Crenothrix polyspora]SJM92227.1 conserved exported hypothetical protein [Crenothrix polyspora]
MINVNHLTSISYTALSASIIILLSACSISNGAGSSSDSAGSMAKSSDSISGSSTSSSKSSENDSKTSRYENETQEFIATYLRSTANTPDQHTFMAGISDVAAQNGIVDWEANPHTYHAIGMALKKINLPQNQYEAYKRQFTRSDNIKMALIQQGYQH